MPISAVQLLSDETLSQDQLRRKLHEIAHTEEWIAHRALQIYSRALADLIFDDSMPPATRQEQAMLKAVQFVLKSKPQTAGRLHHDHDDR